MEALNQPEDPVQHLGQQPKTNSPPIEEEPAKKAEVKEETAPAAKSAGKGEEKMSRRALKRMKKQQREATVQQQPVAQVNAAAQEEQQKAKKQKTTEQPAEKQNQGKAKAEKLPQQQKSMPALPAGFASSYLRALAAQKPTVQFQGEVVYASTSQEIDAACAEIQSMLTGKTLTIGFDMEWQYQPEEMPPALIQLCCKLPTPAQAQHVVHAAHPADANGTSTSTQATTSAATEPQQPAQPAPSTEQKPEDQLTAQDYISGSKGYRCYLLHVARLGPAGSDRMTPGLRALLEEPRIVKATVGNRDEEKLMDDLGVEAANLLQINQVCAG